MTTNSFKTFFLIFIALTSIIPKCAYASDFLKDCQANEKYIECGGCEATCKETVVLGCSKDCKPARCECQSKKGFVRAHDGACIPANECSTYKGAYFGSGGVLLSQSGIFTKNAQKTMLNQVKFVGGAGFSLPTNKLETSKVNRVEGWGKFGGEEISGVSGETNSIPSYNTENAATNNIQNSGQQYGDETNLFHSMKLKDEVIPKHIDDIIPPPVIGHHNQHKLINNKPSHMNLFSDLAESKLGPERLREEGGTNKKQVHATRITTVNKGGIPDRSKAKCGVKCNPEQLQPTEEQRLARIKHLKTKNQPYLYAYMNPPAEEVAIANSNLKGGHLRPRILASPISRINNKKQRMVPLHSGGYDGDENFLKNKVRIRVDDNTGGVIYFNQQIPKNKKTLFCLCYPPRIASGVFIYLKVLLILDHLYIIISLANSILPDFCDGQYSVKNIFYGFCMFEGRFLRNIVPRIYQTVGQLLHYQLIISRPVSARSNDTILRAKVMLTILFLVIIVYRVPSFVTLSTYRIIFYSILDPIFSHFLPFWPNVNFFSAYTLKNFKTSKIAIAIW
ncbi:G_PROTEIN_RECEP_F1_2 domain-containing protein [Meloidogyne graminicola]|uniref:G_PROTEIN_RECEP_F1_2 domain-containing protein n=1 Tax=Meloidogyne graminicola TaxID=189291 RepID=A0A8T0A1M2_9BILA|nr:G_PROTEIN_RECEP_F1_2 domain-containing protein [Meloidogyne graminicola]